MQESQNIEWKEAWRDEYLKWICGFANANGGKIFIGKSDNGEIIGLKSFKKLLEDLLNKISREMATIDFRQLVRLGILVSSGSKGAGSYYILK